MFKQNFCLQLLNLGLTNLLLMKKNMFMVEDFILLKHGKTVNDTKSSFTWCNAQQTPRS